MAVTGVGEIENTIFQYLSNNWTTTDIAWDNVEYDPQTSNEYIAVYVNPNDETIESINGSQKLHRIIGQLVIPVYTPQGNGPGRSKELADQIASLFRSQSIGDVQFRGAAINRVGITNDDSWYRSNVRIEFYADLYS